MQDYRSNSQHCELLQWCLHTLSIWNPLLTCTTDLLQRRENVMSLGHGCQYWWFLKFLLTSQAAVLRKAPLKLNVEQQGQRGLSHSCSQSFCLGQDQLLPVSSLMDVCVLFLFPFSSYFLPAFSIFSFISFFSSQYMLLRYSSLKNLISFLPNSLSFWYAQSVSLLVEIPPLFLLLSGGPTASLPALRICWLYQVFAQFLGGI